MFSDLTDAEAAAYLGRGSGSSTFIPVPDEEEGKLRNLQKRCTTIAAPDNNVPLPRPTAATPAVQETVRYTATLDWRAAGVVG